MLKSLTSTHLHMLGWMGQGRDARGGEGGAAPPPTLTKALEELDLLRLHLVHAHLDLDRQAVHLVDLARLEDQDVGQALLRRREEVEAAAASRWDPHRLRAVVEDVVPVHKGADPAHQRLVVLVVLLALVGAGAPWGLRELLLHLRRRP